MKANRLKFSNLIENMVRFKFFTRIPTENISIVNSDGVVLYRFYCKRASTGIKYGTEYIYENLEYKGSLIKADELINFISGFNINRISVKDSICIKNEVESRVLYGLDYTIEVNYRKE